MQETETVMSGPKKNRPINAQATKNSGVAPDILEERQNQPNQMMPFYRRKQFFVWVGAVVIILDQLTKRQIEMSMPINTSITPFPALYPYFQIAHVANTGTAFGLFPQAKWLFTVLAVVVALWLVYFNYQSPAPSAKLRLTLGLLFGGAIGNLISRFRLGHVTDFLHVNLRPLLQPIIDIPILNWPVFNVADMAVSAGIGIMIYIMLREPETIDEQVNRNEG